MTAVAPGTAVAADGVAAAGPVAELGVYEKALAWPGSWDAFLASAARAGFAFVDLSVDESDARLARLDWSADERAEVRRAADRQGVALAGLCLSAHRRVAPGSADPAVRERAREILVAGIDLCRDLGIPLLQVAGYFAYYEERDPAARERYVEVLRAGARHAARRGVMLGIENVDGADVTSITAALGILDEVDSAWLQLYPDIGNLAEQSLDVVRELAAGDGRMLALHVKDTRPGEPRRVAMGAGVVPWDDAFAELARQGWSGRILVEMWNDDARDAEDTAAAARRFIAARLERHGIRVLPAVPAAVPHVAPRPRREEAPA